jgi:CRP/FNR family transcriptional regulator, cyclic AMP receptor protein
MSILDDVEALKRMELFAKVEPAKLKLMAFAAERTQFRKGEEMVHQGDPADAAYIILEGRADVMVDTPGGQLKVAEVKRDAFVGEIGILCDVPRTATVVAHSDLETLRVSKDGFFHLVTQFPQVGIEVMTELASRLHDTTQALTAARAKLNELGEGTSGG